MSQKKYSFGIFYSQRSTRTGYFREKLRYWYFYNALNAIVTMLTSVVFRRFIATNFHEFKKSGDSA